MLLKKKKRISRVQLSSGNDKYSESYSGIVHQEIAIEGYQYCTSLQRAFESLMFESHTNFIVTVGCITVIVIWGSKYLILM